MFWQFLDNNLMIILAFLLANKAVSFLIAMSMLDRAQAAKTNHVQRSAYVRREGYQTERNQTRMLSNF